MDFSIRYLGLSLTLTLCCMNIAAAAAAAATDDDHFPRVVCNSTAGPFLIEIYPQWAPLGAKRFLDLVKDGFFSDIALFRSVDKFLTQFGISSDKDKAHRWHGKLIKDDVNQDIPIVHYMMSFAGSGANTRSTQVFITLNDLDYLGESSWETPFGMIIDGRDSIDSIYTAYGDMAPSSFGKGPDQQTLYEEGNEYIRREFPKIDFIHSCEVLSTSAAACPNGKRVSFSSSSSSSSAYSYSYSSSQPRNNRAVVQWRENVARGHEYPRIFSVLQRFFPFDIKNQRRQSQQQTQQQQQQRKQSDIPGVTIQKRSKNNNIKDDSSSEEDTTPMPHDPHTMNFRLLDVREVLGINDDVLFPLFSYLRMLRLHFANNEDDSKADIFDDFDDINDDDNNNSNNSNNSSISNSSRNNNTSDSTVVGRSSSSSSSSKDASTLQLTAETLRWSRMLGQESEINVLITAQHRIQHLLNKLSTLINRHGERYLRILHVVLRIGSSMVHDCFSFIAMWEKKRGISASRGDGDSDSKEDNRYELLVSLEDYLTHYESLIESKSYLEHCTPTLERVACEENNMKAATRDRGDIEDNLCDDEGFKLLNKCTSGAYHSRRHGRTMRELLRLYVNQTVLPYIHSFQYSSSSNNNNNNNNSSSSSNSKEASFSHAGSTARLPPLNMWIPSVLYNATETYHKPDGGTSISHLLIINRRPVEDGDVSNRKTAADDCSSSSSSSTVSVTGGSVFQCTHTDTSFNLQRTKCLSRDEIADDATYSNTISTTTISTYPVHRILNNFPFNHWTSEGAGETASEQVTLAILNNYKGYGVLGQSALECYNITTTTVSGRSNINHIGIEAPVVVSSQERCFLLKEGRHLFSYVALLLSAALSLSASLSASHTHLSLAETAAAAAAAAAAQQAGTTTTATTKTAGVETVEAAANRREPLIDISSPLSAYSDNNYFRPSDDNNISSTYCEPTGMYSCQSLHFNGISNLDELRQAVATEHTLEASLPYLHNYCVSPAAEGSSFDAMDALPHVLLMGLGAGSLHMSVLNSYPCAVVHSVEISKDMYIASELMGMIPPREGACGDTILSKQQREVSVGIDGSTHQHSGSSSSSISDEADNVTWIIEPIFQSDETNSSSSSSSSSDYVLPSYCHDKCRSSVIIGDAWDYVEMIHSGLRIVPFRRQEEECTLAASSSSSAASFFPNSRPQKAVLATLVHRPLLYDVILFDVYDDTQWNGAVDSGISNPYIDRASAVSTLLKVRSILRRDGGIGIFYIHRDAEMKSYFRNIVTVFGKDQVVILIVSENACVFIAGRNAFQGLGSGQGESIDADQSISSQSDESSLPDGDSIRNDASSSTIHHPCRYGEQSYAKFAQWVEQNGLRRSFDSYLRHADRYSLDCDSMEEWLHTPLAPPPAPDDDDESD